MAILFHHYEDKWQARGTPQTTILHEISFITQLPFFTLLGLYVIPYTQYKSIQNLFDNYDYRSIYIILM